MFDYKVKFGFFKVTGSVLKETRSCGDDFEDLYEEVYSGVFYCSEEKINFIIAEMKKTDREVEEVEVEYKYEKISKEEYLYSRKNNKENKLYFIKETRTNQQEKIIYVHSLRYCTEDDIREKLKSMKNKNKIFFVDYSYHELAIEAIEIDQPVNNCYDNEKHVIYEQDFLYTLEDLLDFQCKNGSIDFGHTYENNSGFIMDDARFILTYKII